MKNILARSHREVLAQFAHSKVLLAFDYDGTLAPIVANPSLASLREITRKLLTKVAQLYPCIVISGRSQKDVQRYLQGVGLHQIIGNHGMEPGHTGDDLAKQVTDWVLRLQGKLEGLGGVWVENKTFSLAVHYRLSRKKKLARSLILESAKELGKVRIIGGKKVVNILPYGAPHKGVALVRERQNLGCDTAIYVGDDETDEDVFFLRQPGRLLAIRVGKNMISAADYFIPRQRDINELLRVLLDFRSSLGLLVHPKGKR